MSFALKDVMDHHVRLVDQVICHQDVVSVMKAILEHHLVPVAKWTLILMILEYVCKVSSYK